MSEPTSTSPAVRTPQPLAYLDRAIKSIEPIATRILGRKADAAELASLTFTVEGLRAVDPENALLIARTLQHSSIFSELIRSQVADMEVGNRYENIASLFGSIQSDSKRLVGQLADGRIDWKEKLSNRLNDLFKGSITTRFEKIKTTFLEVSADTQEQLEIEDRILSAYLDFRGALKEAQIAAERIRVKQEAALAVAKQALTDAQAAAESAPEGEARLTAQLDRDNALRAHTDADNLYQRVKDIAENLNIAYQVNETVVAKLQQTHQAKKAVYSRSATFFTTNESVLGALSAAFTAQAGLHEASRAQDALVKGTESSLELLADSGTEIQKKALEVAYGKTISVETVQKLAESILTYQVESQQLIAKYRQEATENTAAIDTLVEDTKKQFAANQVAA